MSGQMKINESQCRWLVMPSSDRHMISLAVAHAVAISFMFGSKRLALLRSSVSDTLYTAQQALLLLNFLFIFRFQRFFPVIGRYAIPGACAYSFMHESFRIVLMCAHN